MSRLPIHFEASEKTFASIFALGLQDVKTATENKQELTCMTVGIMARGEFAKMLNYPF